MICECCNRKFKNLNGLTKHIMQHNKTCNKFYLDKYGEKDNFPWKRLSDNKNLNCIICEICQKRCIGQRGISIHVLQHSSDCFNGYVLKYGSERSKWPKSTRLRIRVCKDCGNILKDPRSKKYCEYCKSNFHNIMKDPLIAAKMGKTLSKTFKNNPSILKRLSKLAIKRHKENPELAEKQRKYMLNGGASHARSFLTSPSKPQVKLFNLLQEIVPYPIMEYPCLNKNIDIAIPSLSIAIEYDGSFWHEDSTSDKKRQKLLEKEGWKFIRYIDKIPTKKELLHDINNILIGETNGR